MALPDLSNEQKLTYIYQVLKDQESRRKRKAVLSTLKWIFLIAFVYFAYTYRAQIIDRTYNYATDYIQVQLAKYSEKQKAGILRGIQEILPPDFAGTLKQLSEDLSNTGGVVQPKKK